MKRKYGTRICCVCTRTSATGNRATSGQTGWLGLIHFNHLYLLHHVHASHSIFIQQNKLKCQMHKFYFHWSLSFFFFLIKKHW